MYIQQKCVCVFTKGHIHTRTFIEALFGNKFKLEANQIPISVEFLYKLWYLHTTEFYIATKANKLQIFWATWLNLVILSKRSHTKRVTHSMVLFRQTHTKTQAKLSYWCRSQCRGLRGERGWKEHGWGLQECGLCSISSLGWWLYRCACFVTIHLRFIYVLFKN